MYQIIIKEDALLVVKEIVPEKKELWLILIVWIRMKRKSYTEKCKNEERIFENDNKKYYLEQRKRTRTWEWNKRINDKTLDLNENEDWQKMK